MQCNSLYTPLSINQKWFTSLPTQWRVVGNSVGISKGSYEPKREFPEGRGVQTKRLFMGLGRGSLDIFWTCMFPILLCSRNGDSNPLNTAIHTFWSLLNKLNNNYNLNQMCLFNKLNNNYNLNQMCLLTLTTRVQLPRR